MALIHGLHWVVEEDHLPRRIAVDTLREVQTEAKAVALCLTEHRDRVNRTPEACRGQRRLAMVRVADGDPSNPDVVARAERFVVAADVRAQPLERCRHFTLLDCLQPRDEARELDLESSNPPGLSDGVGFLCEDSCDLEPPKPSMLVRGEL